MSKRIAVLAVLLVALLLAGGASVYAYDHSHRDKIADGVRVNGVALGGLTVTQARARVRAQLLEPLKRRVVVRHAGRRFVLTRTGRELRGGRVDRDVAARITWSRPAVNRLVDQVAKTFDRPAVDASLDLTTGQVNPRPSHTGVSVRTRKLRRAVERTLLSTGARHAVQVRTRVLQPNG